MIHDNCVKSTGVKADQATIISCRGGESVSRSYARQLFIPLLAVLTLVSDYSCGAEVSGAVGTFTYPLYEKWSRQYRAETGRKIHYEPVSSGEGLELLKANKVTFSISEIPLSPSELEQAGLIQWPQIISGVVCIANIGGRQSKHLVLDGDTLSKIYLGEIINWNDVRISALNLGQKLPDAPITPIYRSGVSGTNYIFDHYLSSASEEWRTHKPRPNEIYWPIGFAEKGNEGVAKKVSKTIGAIGFVSFNYAISKKLAYVSLVNKDGNVVTPNKESFLSASQQIDWKNSAGLNSPITNMPGLLSWPISSASYVLIHKKPSDENASVEAIQFFEWALNKGSKSAEKLGYIPAPDVLLTTIRENWREIKGSNDRTLYH